jgi:hypothetical protein
MKDMRRDTPVTSISEASSPRARAQRRMRDLAAAAARTAATPFPEEPPRGGRAWLNGRQRAASTASSSSTTSPVSLTSASRS